jgi:hypothetical protein
VLLALRDALATADGGAVRLTELARQVDAEPAVVRAALAHAAARGWLPDVRLLPDPPGRGGPAGGGGPAGRGGPAGGGGTVGRGGSAGGGASGSSAMACGPASCVPQAASVHCRRCPLAG